MIMQKEGTFFLAYTVCRYKLLNLNLPNMPANCSEAERDIFLHSLLNFDNKLCVYALGALIKFTEINWAHLNSNENAPILQFMHINQASMLVLFYFVLIYYDQH